jgi:hypothetical protein
MPAASHVYRRFDESYAVFSEQVTRSHLLTNRERRGRPSLLNIYFCKHVNPPDWWKSSGAITGETVPRLNAAACPKAF